MTGRTILTLNAFVLWHALCSETREVVHSLLTIEHLLCKVILGLARSVLTTYSISYSTMNVCIRCIYAIYLPSKTGPYLHRLRHHMKIVTIQLLSYYLLKCWDFTDKEKIIKVNIDYLSIINVRKCFLLRNISVHFSKRIAQLILVSVLGITGSILYFILYHFNDSEIKYNENLNTW